MSLTVQPPVAQTPGLCDQITEAGRSGFNWLTTNAKSLAGSVSETASKAWSVVSAFFSDIAAKLSAWIGIGKDAVFAAVDHVKALPNSTKAVFAVAMTAAAVAGGFVGRCFGGSKPAAQPAQAQQVAPQQDQQPAAPAQQQPAAPQPAAPAQQQPAAPVQQQPAAPAQQQPAAPVQQQPAAPVQQPVV